MDAITGLEEKDFSLSRLEDLRASQAARGQPGRNPASADRSDPTAASDPAQDGKDRADISPEARRLSDSKAKRGKRGPSSEANLPEKERKEVEDLRKTDGHVRSHENAHLAAAGNLARGGPKFQYETGPDGQRYAVAGEVPIDTSPGKDPAATLRKAARIRAAALAPADPSPADRQIAANAQAMAAQAQKELSQKNVEGVKPAEKGGRRRRNAPVKQTHVEQAYTPQSTPASSVNVEM
jgi:hypothetical protein